MIREPWINIARRLDHIDFFLEVTMQECISNIKLSQWPVELDCKRENDPHYGWFDNRAECFIKIHTILLMKAFSHKSDLVTANWTINIPFQFVNPLAAHHILTGMRGNKYPSALSLKSLKLLIHCLGPLRILHCNFEAWRLQFCIVNLSCKGLNSNKGLRFGNAIFRPSNHRMGISWYNG